MAGANMADAVPRFVIEQTEQAPSTDIEVELTQKSVWGS